jgi:hypothetical protein
MSRFRVGDLLGWEECVDGKKLVKRLGVLIEDGSVRVMGSSYLFTVDEMEEFEFTT